MTRRSSRGGPGDWIAPLVALVIICLVAWTGARGLRSIGWNVPWVSAPESVASASQAPRGPADAVLSPPASSPGRQSAAAADSPQPARAASGYRDVPVPSAPDAPAVLADDIDGLRSRRLLLPVQGADRTVLRSNFHEARQGGQHEAIDMLAPRGQPVLAVEDGSIAKLFESARGGLTVYQFDPTRRYAYYYAHLDRYAPELHDGQQVSRGQVIGYVGTTGNAPKDTPHLHFTIFKLGADQRWWQGAAIDPYLIFR